MKKLSNTFKFIHLWPIVLFAWCLCGVGCKQAFVRVPINDNIAFPVKLLPTDDDHFLLLNSNASNKYITGSIQKYSIDPLGNPVLNKTFVIEDHGSDIVLNETQDLLALSFDSGKEETKIVFFDYSNPNELKPLPHLTLYFSQTDAKQSIKQIKFFKVNGFSDEFLYGVILTSTRDTGEGKNVPARTFVAKIAKNRESAEILFVLSYNVDKISNEIQTLAPKSNSLRPYFTNDTIQYMLGSTAPTYDANHSLFLALPTGSVNGFNIQGTNVFPQLPPPLKYFSFALDPNLPCESNDLGCNPDLRAVSLFAVDMQAFLNGVPLNYALYFVPLAWNSNGIPYGHRTKDVRVDFASSQSPSPKDDVTSFAFQSGFWATFLLDDKTLLVAKKDHADEEKNGTGNEIFQISGLDILADNIKKINKIDPIHVSQVKPDDFSEIQTRQIIDWFNKGNLAQDENDRPSSTWPAIKFEGLPRPIQNPGPIIPYMFSRTIKDDGKSAFIKAPTVVYDFNFACLPSSGPENKKCFPYWVRGTYLGLGNFGRDNSWLTTQIPSPSYNIGDSPIFKDALSDPTASTLYPFPQLSGAQVCAPMHEKQDIYCVSFLTGVFSKFHFTLSGFVPFN